ncbi:MAG: hypothetical protein JNN17_06055 [Verrucomicrobiaceae bacterium]|nr:hypothetical protein [Verrucomicrobiaceae bacterium]
MSDQSQPVNLLTVSVLPTIVIALWAVYNTWLQHPEKVEGHAKGIFSWFRGFLTRSAKWLAYRTVVFGPLVCGAVIVGICGFTKEWPLSRTNFIVVIECVLGFVGLLLVPVAMSLWTLSRFAEVSSELLTKLFQGFTEMLDRISKIDEGHQTDRHAIEELRENLARAQKAVAKFKSKKD